MIERLRVRIPTGVAGEFSSPELTLCADSSSVSVPPRVTAVARKRPLSFCRKCRLQVTLKHAYTFDPKKLDQAVQAYCGSLSGNELTRKPSGNTLSQSSQLAEPLWTDPGQKSGISVRKPPPLTSGYFDWQETRYRHVGDDHHHC